MRTLGELQRPGLREWFRAWKSPGQGHYGFWLGTTSVIAGLGILALTFFPGVFQALGVLVILVSVYILLAMFIGWKVPPTYAEWGDHKSQLLQDLFHLRDGLAGIHQELIAALNRMTADLGNGTYSGVQLRQDAWTQFGVTIKQDPLFDDVRDVTETAYQAIDAVSLRSYEGAGQEINSREIDDLRRAIVDVDAARSAAAKRLAEMGLDPTP
jgi:hypothetical protein